MEYIRIHNITNVYIYIYYLYIQLITIIRISGEDSSAHTDLTHLYTHSKSLICAHKSDSSVHTKCFGTHLYTHTHTHTFGLGWVGGWGGDGNIPWTCIHSQLYAHKIHNCKNKLVHTANPCRCHAKKRKRKQQELPCTTKPITITFNPQYNC